MPTLEKATMSRHSISDDERKLMQSRIESLILECQRIADEQQDFTQDEISILLSQIESRYPNDKSKWRNNKAVFKVLDRVEKTYKKFINKYSNNVVSSRDVGNYLYNKITTSIDIEKYSEKIIGSYYLIRRAYANKQHINISHLNIFNDKGIFRFKSRRKNNNGHMHYNVEGIVILNSNSTMTLLSLSSSLDSNIKNTFFDSINVCLNNDNVTSRFYGLYNGMCGKHNTPYSTPITFLKTEDTSDDTKIMSMDNDVFMPNGHDDVQFLQKFRIEHDQRNIYKDIYHTITAYPSASYGGLRQFRSY